MATLDDLSKTQIILLTLLVSFVTSIATGIFTTALLAESPGGITQTINRVVEHTIETVAPSNSATSSNSSVREVVVIKEEDAIMGAIEKSSPAVVRIKSPINADGVQNFYALGAVISKNGYIVSDKRPLVENGVYSVIMADGSVLEATPVYTSTSENLTLFKLRPDATHTSFAFLSISKNELKLGQSIIALEGKDKNTANVGRISTINTRTEKDAKGSDIKVIYSVGTDIPGEGEIQGGPLVNLSGELVGIKSSTDELILPRGVYIGEIPLRRILEKAK